MDAYSPIPNGFTNEGKIEVALTLDDGRRIWRLMTPLEVKEWQENGGDPEDLIEDE